MGILRLGLRLTLSCTKRIVIFVCLTALLCVAAGLLGSLLLYGGIDPVTVVVVDEEDSFESRMLLNYLEDYEDYREILRFVRSDAREADAMLNSGEATAVIRIPPAFIAGVLDGGNRPFVITLTEKTPLKAALVKVFADVYADMLKTGQTGVYTALSAAREQGDDAQYQEMYRTANLRYITAMLNRFSMKTEREVSPTGGSGAAEYYGAAALVFLMLLGSVLFLDVWSGAASGRVLKGLAARGNPPWRTGLCLVLTAAMPFAVACFLLVGGIGAASIALDGGFVLSLPLLAALLVLVLCAGAFMLALSRVFGEGSSGSVFAFLFSLAALFLSGGILPEAYLAPALAALGKLTPHYWLSALLRESLQGSLAWEPLVASLAFVVLLAAVAMISVARAGRVGDRP